MIDKMKLLIVAKYLKEANQHGRYPTNDEVVACREIFHNLIDIGNILRLEMLSAWAVSQFTSYNSIAWARGLINPAVDLLNNAENKEKTLQNEGISPAWVLSQLAGMKFQTANSKRDAYDYMKESMIAAGIKIP